MALTCTCESGCRDLNPGPLDPQAGLARSVLIGAVGFEQVERGFSDLFAWSCRGQCGRALRSCVDKRVDKQPGAIIGGMSGYRVVSADVDISTLEPHREDFTLCDGCIRGFMANLDTCEPVLVYEENGARVLVNGHHRRDAARRSRRSHVRAIVEFRPVLDALTYPDPKTPGGCGHPEAPGAGPR